jgi:hypothetical protein
MGYNATAVFNRIEHKAKLLALRIVETDEAKAGSY